MFSPGGKKSKMVVETSTDKDGLMRVDERKNSVTSKEFDSDDLKANIKGEGANSTWLANGVFVIYTHVVGIAALLFYTPPKWMWSITFLLWIISGFGIFSALNILINI